MRLRNEARLRLRSEGWLRLRLRSECRLWLWLRNEGRLRLRSEGRLRLRSKGRLRWVDRLRGLDWLGSHGLNGWFVRLIRLVLHGLRVLLLRHLRRLELMR